jgi:hypothetical protein
LSIGLELNNAFRPANLNAINDEVQIAAQLVIVLSNIYSTRGVVTDQNLDIISEDLANYAYDHTDATIQAAVDAIQNNAGIQAASVGVPVFVINSAKAAAIFGGMSARQNPNDIPLRASNNANTLIQVLIQQFNLSKRDAQKIDRLVANPGSVSRFSRALSAFNNAMIAAQRAARAVPNPMRAATPPAVAPL